MKEGWRYEKLGDICTIERGGSPRPIEDYITDSEDGLNWIKIGDAVDGSKYITSTKERIKPEGLRKTRYVKKGDFILSNSMSFGKPYILDIDGCIHDGWLVIRDDDNTFDKSYLYYVLGSPNMYKEFTRLAVGGVVNNLNTKLVQGVVVAIPPREEQERIVAELDLLSGIIDKQKAQLKELDTLAQSIFYDMFGNLLDATPSLSLKDIASYKIGLTYKPTDVSDEGTIVLRSSNIQNNVLDFDDVVRVNVKVDKKKMVEDGDILMCARNGSARLVGKVARIRNLSEEMSFGAFMTTIKSDYNDFLFYFFLSRYFRNQLTTSQTATINQITSKMLDDVKLNIPSLEKQKVFAEKIAIIDKQKETINQSIAESQKLFDYTMDKYFS